MQQLNELNKKVDSALAAQEAAKAEPQHKRPPHNAGKRVLVFFVVYMLGLAAFFIYTHISDKKWRAAYDARSAAYEADWAAYQAEQAANANTAGAAGMPRSAKSHFEVAPVQLGGSQRVPSTAMFEQAVRREAGPKEQQTMEQLDYAAQVAAYEAQLKAQEDARKAAEARERARQEALEKQEAEQQRRLLEQQRQFQQQQQMTTSPKLGGGAAGGSYGTGSKSATFQPKTTGQTQQSTSSANKGTEVKKLETRRIYGN